MTMILNSFGLSDSVVNVWNQQHGLGGYVYTSGAPYQGCMGDNNNSLKILTERGLSVTDIGTNMDEADRVLSSCGLILASGRVSCRQSGGCGHLLVIAGHQGGEITTLDPWYGENYVHTLNGTYTISRMWAVVP